ncbi:MAG: translation elongation factor Ts [Armatimonadota bacterium]
MTITAADVKKLRDETDAPMMDCKAALTEAGGDFERAKQILREKGKAQAAKKADRATQEGIARFYVSADGKTAAGVIVECETDFVSGNDTFKALVDTLGKGFLARGEAGATVVIDGASVDERITDAVNTIRENIQLRHAELYKTENAFGAYNHHTGKSAALVELSGTASNLKEVGDQLATQVIGMRAMYTNKEDIPADLIAAELQTQINRAIEEGKPANIAENIAKGRVEKEFYREAVLLEQDYFADTKKKVSGYVTEEAAKGGGTITVKGFVKLVVGQSSAE